MEEYGDSVTGGFHSVAGVVARIQILLGKLHLGKELLFPAPGNINVMIPGKNNITAFTPHITLYMF